MCAWSLGDFFHTLFCVFVVSGPSPSESSCEHAQASPSIKHLQWEDHYMPCKQQLETPPSEMINHRTPLSPCLVRLCDLLNPIDDIVSAVIDSPPLLLEQQQHHHHHHVQQQLGKSHSDHGRLLKLKSHTTNLKKQRSERTIKHQQQTLTIKNKKTRKSLHNTKQKSTPSKVWLCKESGCKKTFASEHSLTTHSRTHTGERPFDCPECNKAFKDTSTLNRHRLCHSDERPHVCPDCGMTFKLAQHLKRHCNTQHNTMHTPTTRVSFASN
eukprot:c3824_g1_i2.p1 GENE.c3824_g1_i2~~c3824_g1_i2.p1  ORF type:complete len:269 (-),score=37.64 c3824_g1_i2:198-1004(-)